MQSLHGLAGLKTENLACSPQKAHNVAAYAADKGSSCIMDAHVVGFTYTPSGQWWVVTSPQAPQLAGSWVMRGATAVARTTDPRTVTRRPVPRQM